MQRTVPRSRKTAPATVASHVLETAADHRGPFHDYASGGDAHRHYRGERDGSSSSSSAHQTDEYTQQRQQNHHPRRSMVWGWAEEDPSNDSTTKLTTVTSTATDGQDATSGGVAGNGGGGGGGGAALSTTTVYVENTTRWADWGLTIPIAALFPLFVVKAADTIVPMRSCVNALVAEYELCDAEGQKSADIQYFLVLFLGILGLIVSLVMTRYRISSRPALLGLSYGSMICILYAVFINTHRINNTVQIAILGIIIVGFIFLPRVGGSLMGN